MKISPQHDYEGNSVAKDKSNRISVLCEMMAPGQVHFFKNALFELINSGHNVLATTRDKDIVLELLKNLELPHVCLSKQGHGKLGLAAELIHRDVALLKVVRQFKPDVMIAQTGVSIGIVGALFGIPRIVYEEAEHATLQRMIGLPFANYIMTGTGYRGSHGRRDRKFRGVWGQSYLHRSYFKPDPDILIDAGFDPGEPYVVMRVVAWDAAHDDPKHRTSVELIKDCVEKLSCYRRVFVSYEGPLPALLQDYKMPVPIHLAHQLIAHADLYIGEGASMAAEAAVLGVPSVYCNPLQCGYLEALDEQYHLLRRVNSLKEGVDIAIEILNDPYQTDFAKTQCEKLWAETDDITKFVIATIHEAVKA